MSQTESPICYLAHPGFHMLGEPVFRLSEGARLPSMVIQLEKQDAILPLRSVAREFKVPPESADGQMLDMIEQALDFVVSIRLGDKFPSELNGGVASWQPNEQDRLIASSKMRHNLVRGVSARTGKKVVIDGGVTPGWELAPKNRVLLQDAIDGAATLIDGTTPAEITTRLAAISEEMAYIENMRRTLTKGIAGMRDKLLRVQMDQVGSSRQDTVKQVQTLAKRGVGEISTRFNDVDVRLDDILGMLRDTPAAVAWIRRQRDWFVRTNQAWGPVLGAWNSAPTHFDDFLWKIIEQTYAFLAPRFMPFQEWLSAEAKMKKDKVHAKVW